MAGKGGKREVYFEFATLGNQVRVAAICSVTGTEVHVTGPLNASQYDLQRLALRKLEQRLAGSGDGRSETTGPTPPTSGGRGTLV